MKHILASATVAFALMTTGALANEPIKIGVMAPQEGVFTQAGSDGIRGFRLALQQHGGMVNGRKIEWVLGPTDATPDTAVRIARKLIEQDRVDFIIGPLSGSEGLALRDYAKTIPTKTIVNSASGALETTYVNPASNFFRYNLDGAQWGYGLGRYVVNQKGWKRIATVAADYSFGYTNFLGFAVDFCKAGGEIVRRFWIPLGSGDFASVIAALPDDIDAVYLGVGGTDAINFLNQYQQAGGSTKLIGGTIMADQTVLSARGRAKEALIGTPTSGPQADDWNDPKWQAYVKAYQDAFPANERYPTPSLFATNYYNATKAVLTALDAIGGKLDANQANFHAALAAVALDAPNGKITLDSNRQAIGSSFITEVAEAPDGKLYNTFKAKVDNITQTLGMPKAEFDKIGLPSRTAPDCAALQPKR